MRAGFAVVLIAAAARGQGEVPVKAGDPAPNLTWTKVEASDPASGGPQSLTGQPTVLQFLRPVSANQNAIERWNQVAEQFSGKVNFVWIANEPEDTLLPWLKTHPVRGWLVLDPKEESFKAYGVDGGASVIIDSHGTIAGFGFTVPEEQQVQAVLNGSTGLVAGLQAEPQRMPEPEIPKKPDVPPSEEAYISPSHSDGTVDNHAPDFWVLRGFDLRAILSKVLETSTARIDLPASLDTNARYDVLLVPPSEVDPETMSRLMRESIEKYFHVSITQAIRPADVYVMTATEGKTPPPAKSEKERYAVGGFASSSDWVSSSTTPEELEEMGRKMMAVLNLMTATMFAETTPELCMGMEEGLNRPVVDATGLTGSYDFSLKGEPKSADEFMAILRDQLGLVLTPTQRSIEMTVVRPR